MEFEIRLFREGFTLNTIDLPLLFLYRMQQTRQFTKRRPQSPAVNPQQSIDTLKVGLNKTTPRSGLAIQSSAPIHISHRASPVHVEVHDHQQVRLCMPCLDVALFSLMLSNIFLKKTFVALDSQYY